LSQRGSLKPKPDSYIGAYAAIENLSVLTRDAKAYKSYFPRLVVAP
jgi:predicted nucleic acid-binding protein